MCTTNCVGQARTTDCCRNAFQQSRIFNQHGCCSHFAQAPAPTASSDPFHLLWPHRVSPNLFAADPGCRDSCGVVGRIPAWVAGCLFDVFGGTVREHKFVATPHAPVPRFVSSSVSPACQSPITAVSTLSRSACFFYAAFDSLFPPLRVPAGVACHSTLVATTAQRWQGFWTSGVRSGKCGRTGGRGQSCLEIVADGLPLFQGAQLAVDTTLVSVLRRDGVPRQRSTTQSSQARGAAHGLWSWPGKWEAGGPRNVMSSSTSWRRPICARGLARCGGTDGRLSWLAALPKPLPFLCWSTGAVWVPMVTLHSPLR